MCRRKVLWVSCFLTLFVGAGYILLGGQVTHQPRGAETVAGLAGKSLVSYAKLPLSFEANQGQTDQSVKFLSHGRGYGLFLTGDEAVLTLKSPSSDDRAPLPLRSEISDVLPPTPNSEPRTPDAVLRMKLVGANANAAVTGGDELAGKVNYFIGNDPKQWRTNVPTYAKVRCRNVYPGIDLVYYGTQGGQLEYDFVVAPGANPRSILLAVDDAGGASSKQKAAGSGQPEIDSDGDLVVHIDGEREVRFHKPFVYQPGTGSSRANGHSSLVQAHYILTASNQVRFAVGPHDHTQPLVIDPVLVYSTYLGGSIYDYGNGIAVDSSGNAYVTGSTRSTDFPTANPLQATNKAGPNYPTAFVAKLNPAGSALVYSTYLGGSGEDWGNGIAVDSSGNAYVTGYTRSTDFPTANPFQSSLASFYGNAFVAKFNPAGSALVYSTYMGGSGGDGGNGIAVDSSGNAYVTGYTRSTDFPTANPLQATNKAGPDNDTAFVAMLNPAGSALVYSTYLGGSSANDGSGIAVDSFGNAYVTGYTQSTDFPTANPLQATNKAGPNNPTAFVSKLNPAGSALVYSTYLGGSDNDAASSIAVDSSGNAYMTGYTYSTDFPVVNPLQATKKSGPNNGTAFVSKLNPAGSALVYSTYLGGSGEDGGAGIAADSSGNAYVTGSTWSTDFPVVNPLQATKKSGPDNGTAFVSKLNPAGSALVYSTYLGGSNYDQGAGIAVDSSGNAYVTGNTGSTNFPTANPLQTRLAGYTNSFLVKISASPAPGITFSSPTLTFGSQAVGTTSSAQSVTLTNSGLGPLTITGIAISGDFAFATMGTSCPYTGGTVASSATCTIDVTFTPTATGPLTGSVTITDNNNGVPGSTQTIGLTGTGTAPVAGVSPGGLTFSGQTVGTTSAAQPVTLSNTGSAALTISSIGISGNFAQTNNCGSSVAAGGSCAINVTFTPTAGGTRTGTLTVTDNSNGAAGSTQTVNLNGTGEDFTLGLASGASSSQTASPGQMASYTLSVGGEGGFNQAVTFTCAGAPSESTCTASPNPATVGSSATSVTVTVTTTASSANVPRTFPPLQQRLPRPQVMLMLAALLAAVAWLIREWREEGASRGRAALVPLAAGLLLALVMTTCGGGGGGGGGSSNPGTPAGSYTLTVTGTFGSGSTALSHSITLTLNVS